LSFDAGAVSASLTLDPSQFDRILDAAERRVKDFEGGRHEVKISAVFDNASLSRGRQMFAQLDQQISKDAMSRLRSSPQGSVLGALNALFSPHSVTGAPSASQAAQQGLPGKMISQPVAGGTAGPSSTQGSAVSQALGGGTGTAQSNANQRVSTVGLPQDTTTTDKVNVVGAPTDNNITTTDRVNTVGLPANNTISTEDRVNVTGLPTSGGTITTEDKIDVDEAGLKAKASQAGKDAADAADDAMTREAKSKGSGWFSGFLDGITAMIGKAAGGGGGNGGGKSSDSSSGGNGGGKSSDSSSGGSALDSGLIGGIGPGIAGVSAKATAIVGAVGTALAALPALAGVAGTGLGVALIGGAVAGVIATSPKLKASFTSLGKQAETAFTEAAKPLIPAISAVLNQVPALLKSVEPQLAGIFKVVAPQIQGVFAGLTPVIDGLLGVMRAAAPAFGPFIEALEKLAGNIFPGIETVVKATVPVISQFGAILGQLGSNLGGLFSSAAPAIKASMQVLGDLLSVVGGLLPVLTQLGSIFAVALAPVFTQFGAVVKSLEPVLILVGQVLASLAKAVVGDLVSAFSAVATAVKAATPGLTALATGLGSVFTVMENAGVFAVLGDALENLAAPIGALISTLASGLVPILTQVVTFVAQLSSVIVAQLTAALLQLLPSLTQLATVALAALSAVLPVILPLLVQVAGVLTGALAATIDGIATALTAVITAVPPALLGAVAAAVAAVAGGMKLWAASMAAVEGSGLAGVVTGMIGSLKEFALATEGVTLAEKAQLAGMLALDAISPLAWVAIAAVGIGALVYGLSQLSDGVGGTVSALAKQDDAVGYNISGYQKLAAQTKALGDQQSQAAASIGASAAKGAGVVRGVVAANGAAYTAFSAQFTAVAVNMQTRLTALSGTFGVSKTTIEQWAYAAGITPKAFAGAGESVGLLTTQVAAYIDKNAAAVTSTASLSANIGFFGNSVLSATTQLDAFNAIWNTLVGALLTKQTAITQSATQFQALQQTIDQNGKSSLATSQSFQAYISQIGASVSALEKSGASVGTLNSYLQTQIGNIESLGPLNKGEQADLAALKAAQDAYANSTHGLTDNQLTWIQQAEGHLIPDLDKLHANTPLVNTDIGNLANSIAQTGTASASTAADRAQLIADIAKITGNTKTATSTVDGWITSLSKVPKSVSTAVGVHATATGTLTAIGTTLANQKIQASLLFGAAAGGLIPGPGAPKADDKLIRVSAGEYVMQASSVDRYGTGFMDAVNAQRFAGGGSVDLAGPYSWAQGQDAGWAQSDAMTFMGSAVSAFSAANKAALAAVAAASLAQGLLHPSGTGATIQALMQSMAASVGWTGAEWTALNAVEMREAGYALTATNPSSGAYGLAQFIGGPSEYASYGGNSTTAQGQIVAMINYVKSRYGDPIAALAHEQKFGWYGNGGMISEPVIGRGLNSGRGYVLGERGSEMVTPVGGGQGVQPITDGLSRLEAKLDRLIDVGRQAPAATGQHVGAALGGAAHDASFRARYPRN
jgi:phage-related protein